VNKRPSRDGLFYNDMDFPTHTVSDRPDWECEFAITESRSFTKRTLSVAAGTSMPRWKVVAEH